MGACGSRPPADATTTPEGVLADARTFVDTGTEESLAQLSKLPIDDLDHYDESDGYTALFCAASYGLLKFVALLCEKGASVNKPCRLGETPLHAAAAGGHEEIVEVLCDNGGNVDAADDQGWTAFHFASANSQVSVMRTLVKRGCNTSLCSRDLDSPLHLTAAEDYVEGCKFLVEDVCSTRDRETTAVTSRNIDGDTPVHTAARCGAAVSAAYLLKFLETCEIGQKRKALAPNKREGLTPPMLAALCGHVATLSALLTEPIALDTLSSGTDETVLQVTARSCFDPQRCSLGLGGPSDVEAIVECVLEADKVRMSSGGGGGGVPLVDRVDSLGRTAAHLVCGAGAGIGGIGVGFGVADHHSFPFPPSPPALAAAPAAAPADSNDSQRAKVLRLLAKHSSRPPTQDKQGRTPLHYAARHGWAECTRVLLGEGKYAAGGAGADTREGGVADVDCPDHDGFTALLHALASGHNHGLHQHQHQPADTSACIDLLLERGARWNAVLPAGFAGAGVGAGTTGAGVGSWAIDHLLPLGGATLLHVAARKGDGYLTEALVSRYKLDPSVLDAAGNSPLHVCIRASEDWHAEADEFDFAEGEDNEAGAGAGAGAGAAHDPKAIPLCMQPLLTAAALQTADAEGTLPHDLAAELGRPYAKELFPKYFGLIYQKTDAVLCPPAVEG